MIRRFLSLVQWIVTGNGFFPEQKPVVPIVLKPEVTVEVVRPQIPSEHDSLCNTVATLISGCVARGGIPNTDREVAKAVEIHRYVRETLERENALSSL
jgi:hypothetical protein